MAHNYSSSEILEIAKTINNQIVCTTNCFVIGSWDISKKAATVYNDMPALALRVSGVYHKGLVYICYNEGNDAYDLFFVNTKGSIKKKIEEIYCDNLGDVLDRNIERGYTSEEVYIKKAKEDSVRKFIAENRKYNR